MDGQERPGAQTALYFCPVCSKPFDQETSFNRHVQYCRRRAARGQQSKRQKACRPCSKTKSKCDFGRPTCSRCAAKGALCAYVDRPTETDRGDGGGGSGGGGQIHDTAATSSALVPLFAFADGQQSDQAGGALDPLSFSLLPASSASVSSSSAWAAALLSGGQEQQQQQLSLGLGLGQYPGFAAAATGTELYYDGAFMPDPAGLSRSSPSYGLAPPELTVGPDEIQALVMTTTSNSSGSNNSVIMGPTRPSWLLLTDGCRRLILAIIRSYPRMVTTPDNLPPFVHRLGCGIHFAGDAELDDVGGGGAGRSSHSYFLPLEPLAASIRVAHLFASRTWATAGGGGQYSDPDGKLWRAIDTEHARISEAIPRYTPGETLAAIQAMMIFTTIRVIVSGSAYFAANTAMLRTMGRLTGYCAAICDGYFMPARSRATRPSWEEWICEETRRRITLTCFLMALMMGFDGSDITSDPHLLSLPCGKALWEARSRSEWEREYDAIWARDRQQQQHQHQQPRLETLGDLMAATNHAGAAGLGGIGYDDLGPAVDVLLDTWHAGVDGLGTMLAAVVSGL